MEILDTTILILGILTSGAGGVLVAKYIPGAVPFLGVVNKTIKELVELHKEIEQSNESILKTAEAKKLKNAIKEIKKEI